MSSCVCLPWLNNICENIHFHCSAVLHYMNMPVVIYFIVDGYFSTFLFSTKIHNADVNIRIFCVNVCTCLFGYGLN